MRTEKEDYSIMYEYIQKANEKSKDINYLAKKFIDVLLTLEMADIEPKEAFNYIVINLDRMKGNNEI